MLSNIIKIKLEENRSSFKKVEEFFANSTFDVIYRKGFKDSSAKLVIEHFKCCTFYKTLTLTLPREGIPNSFALNILSSLYKENNLALPIILKYLIHRDLSEDFDNISRKLQAKVDEDIQAQNDPQISKEIGLCKKDILNVLNGGKSVLGDQPKERYQEYYSLINSEVKELKDRILRELENYVENTDIHKIYQSLNNKIKKISYCGKIRGIGGSYYDRCQGSGTVNDALASAVFFVLMLFIATPICAISASPPFRGNFDVSYFLKAFMYTAIPFLVAVTVALTIALVNIYYEQSFEREIKNFIEEAEPRHMDKATNTENVEEPERQLKEQEVKEDLRDYKFNNHQLIPTAPTFVGSCPNLYPSLAGVPTSLQDAYFANLNIVGQIKCS